MRPRPLFSGLLALTLALSVLLQAPARAADRGRLEAFLEVTGYDVVIESLRQGAMSGPGLVGDAPEAFGRQYAALAGEVFDVEEMQARALDILAAVMPDELVTAGAEFYASDLGQRLVAAENESHLADDERRYAEGQDLIAALTRDDPARIRTLLAMNAAIGSEETSRRAIVEIQLRFMLAAARAGAVELRLPEPELRRLLTREAEARSEQVRVMGLIGNAWTYRDISDADLDAYRAALETPEMRQVYEILNAVQYQVMIERYEILGARLAELTPAQDL